jgi:hypothetical protein
MMRRLASPARVDGLTSGSYKVISYRRRWIDQERVVTEQEVVEVRATGRTPEAVAAEVQQILSVRQKDDCELFHVQPIIITHRRQDAFCSFSSDPPR